MSLPVSLMLVKQLI